MELFSVSKTVPGLWGWALQPSSKEPLMGLDGGAGQGKDVVSWAYVR